MKRVWVLLVLGLVSACSTKTAVVVDQGGSVRPASSAVTAVGHGVMSQFKGYPEAQQKLLAIRGARMDAYRNLAEELNGVRIKGVTTVKDTAVENDSYRSYVDAVVRGARLVSVMPKGDGIYEAEVELRLQPFVYQCLSQPTASCLNTHVAAAQLPAQHACGGCDSVNTRYTETCNQNCDASAYPYVDAYHF